MSNDRLILAFVDIALPVNKASAGATVDHLGPWANPFWRYLTGVDGAPWHLTATPRSTGRTERELSAIRQFIIGLMKEQSRYSRRQFIWKPSPPSLADGRDQLSYWLEVSWAKWDIDGRLDALFRTEGFTYRSSQGTIPQISLPLLARIAAALFGPGVVRSFDMVDAEITGWLFTILIYTSGRWRGEYAARQALVEEVICCVSLANRGRPAPQNVFSYLKTFRHALSGQNLDAIGSHIEDPLYHELLSVLLRERGQIAGGKLFARLTSDTAQRDDIISIIDDCLRTVRQDLPSTPSCASSSNIHVGADPVLDDEVELSSESKPCDGVTAREGGRGDTVNN